MGRDKMRRDEIGLDETRQNVDETKRQDKIRQKKAKKVTTRWDQTKQNKMLY